MASTSRTHEFKTEIRNHAALSKIASRLDPLLTLPEPPVPAPKSDFFEKLNMAAKIELNSGDYFTIDVQPDLRFPFYYSLYNTTRTFPDNDIKPYPYVSPFSLVAYEQCLLIGQLLLNDMHNRPIVSYDANSFRRNNGTKDFLDAIQAAIVPAHMEPVLQQLVGVIDPNRPQLVYVPDLAAFSWKHDFGRLVPPAIMLIAHNIIARVRGNAEPEDILRQFYQTVVTTIHNEDYTVAHFLGGYYRIGVLDYEHINWLNQAVEDLFNPIVGRALTNRPTLAKIRLTPVVIPVGGHVNPYALLLNYNQESFAGMSGFIEALSNYHQDKKTGNKSLIQVGGQASGITIMSHSLEPPTLPTWHNLNPAAALTTIRTDANYAADIYFMQNKVLGNAVLNIPELDDFPAILVLARRADCTAANDPFPAQTFNANRDVRPPVLYFQPYDRAPSTLNYVVVLGLKIESAELDGLAIPVPNVSDSLIDNNSRYRQGSLPVLRIQPCTWTAAEPLIITQRTLHPNEDDPSGHAINDMTRVIVPQFGDQHGRPQQAQLPGFVAVGPIQRPEDCFTYTANAGDNAPPTGTRLFYLWSSYRYVEQPCSNDPLVHMFYSLRGMYGTSVTLSRSENPSRLLPR